MKKINLLVLSLVFALSIAACQEASDTTQVEDPIDETPADILGDWIGFGVEVIQTQNDVTINYEGIPGDWWHFNTQLPVTNFDAARSSVIFTFTGVAGHQYLFKIEGGGYDTELGILGTGNEQTLELDLTRFTATQRAQLNLIVVFVQTPGASGSVSIHSVSYGAIDDTTDPVGGPPSLTTPFGVLIQFETEVAWGSIPEASSFNVYVSGVEGSPFRVEAGFFALDLEPLALPSGIYVIQIRAIGDGVNFIDSELSYPILHLVDWHPGEPGQGSSGATVLPTPFGIIFNPNEVVWGAIPEASSFDVYIDGVEGSPFSVPAGFYALNLAPLALPSGFYIIQIRAIGDGVNFVDSVLTSPVIYVVD